MGLVIPKKNALEGIEENKDEDKELNLEQVKVDLQRKSDLEYEKMNSKKN